MLNRRLTRFWPQLLIGLISILLYCYTFGGDFLRWDDRQNILLNPWLAHHLWSMIWLNPYYNMYIPVTYTFWTGLWQLAPNIPIQFHVANVLLHASNAIWVYLLSRLILRRDERLAAVFAALFFACHPLQVETVAWISTGRDLLAAFFSLAAMYTFLKGQSRTMMALSTLLFTISCLSKPSVAIVPVALLLLTYAFSELTFRRLWTLALWMIPAVTVSIMTKRIQQLDSDLRLTPMGLGDRLLVALDTLSFYVQKLLFPYPLAADYGRMREFAVESSLWVVGLVILILAGVMLKLFWARIEKRYLYFAALFVVLLIPILGVIPFQAQAQSTVSDRYTYFPLIGAGLLFGTLCTRWKVTRYGFAFVVLPALCVLTFMRTQVWSTNEVFFRDMLEKNENSHVALSSLGVEYILTHRLPQAEEVLNRAAALRPMDVIPRTNLAQLYLLENRPDRVVTEIAPLLDNKEFLRINQTETRALSSAYRLAARAHWGVELWSKANEFYCRFRYLDPENAEGLTEYQRFIGEAQRHKPELISCAK